MTLVPPMGQQGGKYSLTYFVRGSKTVPMADLLFDWLGFSRFVTFKLTIGILVWLNPNQ